MAGPRIGIWLMLVAIYLLLCGVAEEMVHTGFFPLFGLIVGGLGILVGLVELVPKGDVTE